MSLISSSTKSNGTRLYTSPKSGNSYPSVTTILSKFEDRRKLKEWKEKNENHAELSRHYSTTGTRVHSCNEQFLLNNGTVDFDKYKNDEKIPDEVFEEIVARHNAYLPFLSHVTPIGVEEKLIWENYTSWGQPFGFGGTADCIGSINSASTLLEELITLKDAETGKRSVITQSLFEPSDSPLVFVSDFKNWSSAKGPDMCLKAFCQIAAYAAAKNQYLPKDSKIRHGFVLGTTCSAKKKKSNLYIYYLSLVELDFYYSWFYKFMLAYNGIIPKEDVNWFEFKELAVGYLKVGEDENGKAIWGKRDQNYLGKKLRLISPSTEDTQDDCD